MKYSPGDHVGIYPPNRKDIVDSVLERLDGDVHPDHDIMLDMNHGENGKHNIKQYKVYNSYLETKYHFGWSLQSNVIFSQYMC